MRRQEKLPPEQKSQVVSFRLDPKTADGAWALDQIDTWKRNNPNGSMTELFLQLLEIATSQPRASSELKIKAGEIRKILRLLEDIRSHVESGQWVHADSGAPVQFGDLDIDDGAMQTINHYVSLGGLTADEVDDE